jgi:hypothetical protein
MTSLHLIEAIIFTVVAVVNYAMFFRGDIRRWIKTRGPRRERAEREAKERAAAAARLCDELAAKYPLPSPPPR